MEVRFWAKSDVGRERDHNEDSFLVDKSLQLFICCDGMGGHAAGEVASSSTVHAIWQFLSSNREVLDKYAADHAMVDRRDVLALLEHAVHHACTHVHELALADPRRRGMGTTLDALLVCGRRGFAAHVGDSRIYLLRQGQVHQLTEDHSLLNELRRRGKLRQAKALEGSYQNAVTRAVGVHPSVEVDTIDFELLPDDRLLLCSDGLHGYIDEDEDPLVLQQALADAEPAEIPASLVDYANDSGGKDNITVVLVEINEGLEPGESIESTDNAAALKLKLNTLKGIPLFRYLNYKELVKLLNVTATEEFRPGAVIMKEGELGDALYVILQGEVVVTKQEQELTRLSAGSHFGEMALVDKAPRSATVTAQQRTQALVMRRDAMFRFLRRDHQLASKLLWSFVQVLSVRLRRSSADLVTTRAEGELLAEMTPLFAGAVDVTGERPAVTQSLIKAVGSEPEDVDMLDELETSDNIFAAQSTIETLKRSRSPFVPPPPPAEALGASAADRTSTMQRPLGAVSAPKPPPRSPLANSSLPEQPDGADDEGVSET